MQIKTTVKSITTRMVIIIGHKIINVSNDVEKLNS
jgi:hypothetical protein